MKLARALMLGVPAALAAALGSCSYFRPAEPAPVRPKPAVELTTSKAPLPIFNAPVLDDPQRSPRASAIGAPVPSSLSIESLQPSAARPLAAAGDSRPEVSPPPAAAAAAGETPSRARLSPLDDLFSEYSGQLKALIKKSETGDSWNDFDAIQKADLEKRLMAMLFLRDRRDLKEYRDLLDSIVKSPSPVLSREILQAAFLQELGLTQLRDQVLQRLPAGASSVSPASSLTIRNLSMARTISGYRNLSAITDPVLSAGQEVFIYGEFEGYRSVPASAAGGARQDALPSFRRSFAASTSLFDDRGELLERRALLLPGQATEIVDRADKPVYFWGRFNVPSDPGKGKYRLEILAIDLESHATAAGAIPFTVGRKSGD